MTILGIETATPEGGVALVNETGLIEGQHFNTEKGRAAELLPAVDALLHNHRMTLSDVAGIAVSVGPGSYTGVRVGLAAAKGLSLGVGIPILPVSTLEAYAATTPDYKGWVVSLLPARRDEVYWGLFSLSPLARLCLDTVSTWEAALDDLKALNHDLWVVGSNLPQDRISDRLGQRCAFSPIARSVVEGVAIQGLRQLFGGDVPAPESVLPVYLSGFPGKRAALGLHSRGPHLP
jgi:tRNA threonylcarbamoyl adenosine modification protein YeaZ